MKVYFIALIVIVVAGFSFIGLIIYNAFPHPPQPVVFYLNTGGMIEADNTVVDSTNGPTIIHSYPCKKNSNTSSGVPWADLFLCRSVKKDTLHPDTVLILDTRLQHTNGDFERDDFWTGVKPTIKLNACRVLLPENEIKRLIKYKYKYGQVFLITDD